MAVDSIRVHMPSGQHVVVLKEKDADRFLPIWVGMAEANAIALKISGVNPERPVTHDLMANMLQALGVKVTRVVVSELRNDTFHALILGQVGGRALELDSRSSDAIALALRVDSPIFVAKEVLEQAAVVPKASPEDEKLQVFQQMINDMNLPDLGDREA